MITRIQRKPMQEEEVSFFDHITTVVSKCCKHFVKTEGGTMGGLGDGCGLKTEGGTMVLEMHLCKCSLWDTELVRKISFHPAVQSGFIGNNICCRASSTRR